MPTRILPPDDAFVDALLRGIAGSEAALCLCDAGDRIRFANRRFRDAFMPQFDGEPTDFIGALETALRAGTGIRLAGADPDAFARKSRRERRELVGSHSFSTDTSDGGWWSVTHTKLSNGWILVVAQDITGPKREEERLRDADHRAHTEANTGCLTNLPDRRHGLRQAESLWRAAQTDGRGFAAALLDVDHFKAINDA